MKNEDRARGNRLMRVRVVQALGAKCVRCGFEDIRALQIHHVVPCLSHSQSPRNPHAYTSVVRGVDVDKYQLLCANCHAILTHDIKGYNSRI